MGKEIEKPIKEPYGTSTIQLVEVEMTEDPLTEIKAGNTRVLLNVLNLKKYDPNCHCYALIETLKMQLVTMVDLIYSYGELNADSLTGAQKEGFFRGITRSNINSVTARFPGMLYQPQDPNQVEPFKRAILSAFKDANTSNNKSLIIGYRSEKKRKKKVRPSADEIRDDGFLVELMKTFYESITLSKVKRPTDLVEKTVSKTTRKRALLSKCGSIITAGVESGKYFTTFGTNYKRKEDGVAPNNISFVDYYSLYVSGVDDERLVVDSDYKEKFGMVFLKSDILETLLAAGRPRLSSHPRLLYGGEYNEDDERMELGEDVGETIKKLNDAMFPKNKEKSGEGR